MRDLTRKKNQLRSSLDCANAAYGKAFEGASLYTDGSPALLEDCMLPEEFSPENPDLLAEIYNKASKKNGRDRIGLLRDETAGSVAIQYAKEAHAYGVRFRVRLH